MTPLHIWVGSERCRYAIHARVVLPNVLASLQVCIGPVSGIVEIFWTLMLSTDHHIDDDISWIIDKLLALFDGRERVDIHHCATVH